ncbi:MAG: polysaccharide biosynthesis C-terminal domain-containing protein [Clostridiales bacterium]|nr:polysaccharide biosynthesis C-terminal domain-containing protein [Clostridiales bacterium]
MNLILNIILIRKYGAVGACIGTIVAEFFVMLYQIIKTREIIDFKPNIRNLLKYMLKGIIIYIYIIILNNVGINNVYIKLFIQVLGSVIIYFMLNIRYIRYDFLGRKK